MSWNHDAETTTLPLPDCLNSVHHLQPKCLEDRCLPLQTMEKSTAEAQSLRHVVSHLLAVLRLPSSLHLLAQEIHRKMTAQSCPCKILVFKETFHQHAKTDLLHNVQKHVQDIVLSFSITTVFVLSVFVLTVFMDESSVALRLCSSCTLNASPALERQSSGCNIYRADVWEDKPLPFKKKNAFQFACITHDTSTISSGNAATRIIMVVFTKPHQHLRWPVTSVSPCSRMEEEAMEFTCFAGECSFFMYSWTVWPRLMPDGLSLKPLKNEQITLRSRYGPRTDYDPSLRNTVSPSERRLCNHRFVVESDRPSAVTIFLLPMHGAAVFSMAKSSSA